MLLEENKPLAPFTTFGIGGRARWFAQAATEDEIVEATAWARERGLELFVLGGGSNLLVADAGFDGLVLKVGLRGIAVAPDEGQDYRSSRIPEVHPSGAKAPINSGGMDVRAEALTYQAAAGEDWDGFVERVVNDNRAGVECLAGIPGTVGGTPVQNVGAYGQEVASVIQRVRAFDLRQRAFVELSAAECGFSYGRSRFNSVDRGGAPTLGYPELRRAVQESQPQGREANLAEVAAVVRSVRQSKGMLLVEGDPDCRSAGSFFKNPVVAEADLRRIAERREKEPPSFPAGPGMVKVPAAWLIEQAGFGKGYTLGRAAVSSRHTLALVNFGGATAVEILALADQIAAGVEARFGVSLEMEPVMVGF